MATLSHPLADHGRLESHEVFNAAPMGHPADWRCLFTYQRATVEQRYHNDKFAYATKERDPIERIQSRQ